MAKAKKVKKVVAGATVTKQWFDKMEQVLGHEAALAGLFDHGVSTGTAREFFVARVLRTFLPSAVHIGSGQIFATSGTLSNQIDVIVYDPRVPFLEVSPGLGLYMIEGVIATVEVKSKLYANGLREALTNCFSVLSLTHQLSFRDNEAIQEGLENVRAFGQKPDPEGQVMAALTPRTYVFGYKGFDNPVQMGEIIQDWFQRKGDPGTVAWPWLPRVIVAGGCVGMARDEGFSYEPDDAEAAAIDELHGEHAVHSMLVATTTQKFGILAVHLLRAVVDRLGPMHDLVGAKYDFYPYLPVDEYLTQWAATKNPYWVVRGSTRPLVEEKPAEDEEEEEGADD